MASFTPDRDKIRASVYVKGVRKSKVFDYAGRSKSPPKAALEWAAEMERKLATIHGDGGSLTLREVFQKYQDEITINKKGARWESLRITALARDEIADIMIQDLNSDDLEEWAARTGKRKTKTGTLISPASIAREMTIIKSVVKQAKKWKYISSYPFEDVSNPPQSKHRNRRIYDRDLEKLCEVVHMSLDNLKSETGSQRVVLLFLFAIESGMRLGEICALRKSQINVESRWLEIDDSKNGEGRIVPLSSRAVEIVRLLITASERKSLTDFNTEKASSLFRKVRRLADIHDMTFHDSRHEACSRFAKNPKIDTLKLAKIIGHKNPKTLMIYFNPTGEELASLLD